MATTSPSEPRRVIAHMDADAFYATVHLLEDPTLKGQPVIVAGSGPRSIVTTASYEARRFGIGSAMPAAKARRLCPHGIFLRPDFDLYRAYSRRAMEIVNEHVSRVEPLSLDEAYLDLSDVDRPIQLMRDLVAQITESTGLTYSVGIGPNKLCAKVLSDYRKPRAFNVASAEQCCTLFAQHSPRTINGIGPKTVEQLASMGVTTIEQLRSVAVEQLAPAFGMRRAAELQARARFEHDGAVQAHRERKSLSEETTFDVDIADIEELDARMRMMAGTLCQSLNERQLRGRTIGIKVRLDDFTTVTRARTIDAYTDEVELVADIASELLRAYDPSQPVRLIGIRMAAFEHERRERAVDAPGWEQLQLPCHA